MTELERFVLISVQKEYNKGLDILKLHKEI